VQYNEILQTPPITPASSHSLPNSIQKSPQVYPIEPPEPRRRSSSRQNESWELDEFRKKSKGKRGKVKILIQRTQSFSKREGYNE